MNLGDAHVHYVSVTRRHPPTAVPSHPNSPESKTQVVGISRVGLRSWNSILPLFSGVNSNQQTRTPENVLSILGDNEAFGGCDQHSVACWLLFLACDRLQGTADQSRVGNSPILQILRH